jgi:hypothetical protein
VFCGVGSDAKFYVAANPDMGANSIITGTSGRDLGVSQNSPAAKLHLNTLSASKIGEIIQLAVSQTADALQVRNNSGTVLMDVDANGTVQAAGYKSSDGSAGWTGTFTSGGGQTVTVKNGLITNVA